MRWFRMPDGEMTTDLDVYIESWRSLCRLAESVFDGYTAFGFDPDIALATKDGHSLNLSVHAIEAMKRGLETKR